MTVPERKFSGVWHPAERWDATMTELDVNLLTMTLVYLVLSLAVYSLTQRNS